MASPNQKAMKSTVSVACFLAALAATIFFLDAAIKARFWQAGIVPIVLVLLGAVWAIEDELRGTN